MQSRENNRQVSKVSFYGENVSDKDLGKYVSRGTYSTEEPLLVDVES